MALVLGATAWLKSHLVKVQDRYWDVRGEQTLSVGDARARFEATRRAGGPLLRWMHDHESSLLETVLSSLREDDVFFDVGANIGLYTCLAMSQLPRGTVVAFEPYPPNVRQLERNVARNDGDARVQPVALADAPGTVELYVPEDERVGYQRPSLHSRTNTTAIAVDKLAGDTLVEEGEFPRPSVLKVDVEGAEHLVLEGLRGTLESADCREVFCEVHLPADGRPSVTDFGGEPADVEALLDACGFDVAVLEERNQDRVLRASKG